MSKESCVYCCNSQYDNAWSFEFCIMAPSWKGCTSGNLGTGFWYDWHYKKFIRCCDCHNYSGCDRYKGQVNCACIFWSKEQNSTHYVSRMCVRTSDTSFQSVLAGGNYPTNEGGDLMIGMPCWTIWGIPCDRPQFGTCSMDAS